MDTSTEFDQCACYLVVACDPSTTRPRNKTLTAVVHVLSDEFLGNPSLVRPLAPVSVDPIVIYCFTNADTIKEVYTQNSSLLCEFSILGDNDTRRCVLQIHLLSKLVGNVLPPPLLCFFIDSYMWEKGSIDYHARGKRRTITSVCMLDVTKIGMNHNWKKISLNFLKGYICQIFIKSTLSPKSAAAAGIVEAAAFLDAHSWKLVAHPDGHNCFQA